MYNVQSCILMGPFVATSEPELKLLEGAFDGKFNAHVMATAEGQLLQVKCTKIDSGPKTMTEVEALKARLQQGEFAPMDVQEAWWLPGDDDMNAEAAEEPVE